MRRAITLVVLATGTLGAQAATPVRLPANVTCPSCRITLAPLTTLGDADGPGSLAMPPAGIRVDGRGRYWVWSPEGDGGPVVYDTHGRFLRVTGRKGQGPGEFEMVVDVIPLPGDSVLVMDYQRRTTLFAPDLSVVRHIPHAAALSQSIVVDWPRSIVGFNHYAAGGRGGPVLHFMTFDSTARVTKSFGPEWRIPDFATMTAANRILTPATAGIWAASYEQYRIEHWTRDGQSDLVLEGTLWPPRTGEGLGKPDEPPPNSLQAVAQDADGRLWVFISVAAPTWREGWPKGSSETRLSSFAREKMHRTVVEVLDPKAGRVVARRQLDEWIIAALPGNRAVVYTADANDIPKLRIVRLSLEGAR